MEPINALWSPVTLYLQRAGRPLPSPAMARGQRTCTCRGPTGCGQKFPYLSSLKAHLAECKGPPGVAQPVSDDGVSDDGVVTEQSLVKLFQAIVTR